MPDIGTTLNTQVCHPKPAKREQISTRRLFFVAGFATAAWAALVPFAKLNTQVNDGTLGLLLLCLGGGALVAMPLTGLLTTRYGCRKVMAIAVLLFSLILPLLSIINTPYLLAIALLLFGVGVGITDCAMNVQAIIVEKAAEKPMMSGFHGFYSIGGIAGAISMSALMLLGLSAFYASVIISAIVIFILLQSLRGLLNYANPLEGPAFAIPRGAVLVLGAICFATFLAEGTVLDWSAVFLTEYRAMPDSLGGLGFACFAIMMTIGRLTGDKIVSVFGSSRVVFWGAILAAIGFSASILIPFWLFTLIGYGLVGIGCANIVPVMFSAVGRQTSMPQVVAVPAITTLGYMGILAGPATVGFVAYQYSLASAFLIVAVLLLLIALVSRIAKV